MSNPWDKDRWKRKIALSEALLYLVLRDTKKEKKKKKKISRSRREIRKLKIQNFGLLPLTGCVAKSFQPQRAEKKSTV